MSIFKTMVELQHKFNEETTPNYLEKNLNWNSAIIVESGELLDSLGYKWWSSPASPFSEKLRMYYYYKDGNIFCKQDNTILKSSLVDTTGYLTITNNNICFDIGVSTITLHRLIFMIHNGDIPEGCDVDHIDQNKLNNKINNLRLLSKRDNQINSKKVIDAKGYYKTSNGKFQSQIRVDGKKVYLGTFDNEKEASIAYQSAKEIYHIINPIKANGFKNCIDMDNVKVEAIDLLHFVISETLQRNYTFRKELGVDFFNETIEEFRNPYTSFLFKKYESKGIEHLIYLLNKDEYPRFTIMKQIFKTLNMSNEDVYIAYITKNCLNKFRQANGYKNGTYKKYWNDKEDNVIAFELANKLGASENLFDELYKELETYYKQI